MKRPGQVLFGTLIIFAACSGGKRVEVRPPSQDQLPEPATAAPPVFDAPSVDELPDKDDVAEALGAGGYAVSELDAVALDVEPAWTRAGVRELYTRTGGEFLWSEGPYLTRSAKKMLRLLRDADNHGVSSRKMHASLPVRLWYALDWNLKLIKAVKPPSPRFIHLVRLRGVLLSELDAQLSASAMVLSMALRPTNKRGADLASLIPAAERQEKWLRWLLPWHPQYWRLVRAVGRYTKYVKQGGFPRVDWSDDIESLAYGSQNAVVGQIRQRLRAEGFYSTRQEAENYFGAGLQQAIRAFKYSRGLTTNTIVDSALVEHLNVSPRHLIKRLKQAIHAWRTSRTRKSHTFLQVNMPEFMVELYRRGRRVRRHRAVIGYAFGTTGGRTKQFNSKINEVVINPTWTPSETILENELMPKERKTPGYLAAKGFRWFTRKSGKRAVFQVPGKKNTLGQAMLRFPNENFIYLHGSTDRTQYDSAKRARSHGCVRVEAIERLALDILQREQQLDEDELSVLLANEKTRKFQLKTPLPVHFEYIMAVVDDDKVVRFLPDVYRRHVKAKR